MDGNCGASSVCAGAIYARGSKKGPAPVRAAECAFAAVGIALVNAPLFALHAMVSRHKHIPYMEIILAYWQMHTRVPKHYAEILSNRTEFYAAEDSA